MEGALLSVPVPSVYPVWVVGCLSVGVPWVMALSLWLYSAVHDYAGMTNLAFVYSLVLTRRLSLVRSTPLPAWSL